MPIRIVYYHLLWLSLCLSSIIGFRANAQEFGMPIQCNYGENCFIQNYVDVDIGEEYQDYKCGPLSYPAHKGTDFRLRDFAALQNGFKVLAVQDGIVKGVRNHVEDRKYNKENAKAVENQECGNGLVIDHGNGWESQYCHLRQGSIRVASSDSVKKGDILGIVGLSGKTEFPHLHLSLRFQGEVRDPFKGNLVLSDCKVPSIESLWDTKTLNALQYIPTMLLNAHFAEAVPKAQEAREGEYRASIMQQDSDVIVFWVDIYGILKGDILSMKILDPNGKELASHQQVYSKNKAQIFHFIGKKGKGRRWPVGVYQAHIDLLRSGEKIIQQIRTIKIK